VNLDSDRDLRKTKGQSQDDRKSSVIAKAPNQHQKGASPSPDDNNRMSSNRKGGKDDKSAGGKGDEIDDDYSYNKRDTRSPTAGGRESRAADGGGDRDLPHGDRERSKRDTTTTTAKGGKQKDNRNSSSKDGTAWGGDAASSAVGAGAEGDDRDGPQRSNTNSQQPGQKSQGRNTKGNNNADQNNPNRPSAAAATDAQRPSQSNVGAGEKQKKSRLPGFGSNVSEQPPQDRRASERLTDSQGNPIGKAANGPDEDDPIFKKLRQQQGGGARGPGGRPRLQLAKRTAPLDATRGTPNDKYSDEYLARRKGTRAGAIFCFLHLLNFFWRIFGATERYDFWGPSIFFFFHLFNYFFISFPPWARVHTVS